MFDGISCGMVALERAGVPVEKYYASEIDEYAMKISAEIIRLIMEQMGHTDISCTESHYHRNRRSIDAKSQIISSIPEFQAK